MKRIAVFCFFLVFATTSYCRVIFESFEDTSGFETNKAANAEMRLETVKGRTGKAFRLEFDLTNDHFVELGRKAKIDLDTVSGFRWFLKGKANSFTFEIKFVDKDGSTFGKKIPISKIDENEWTEFNLPLRECRYMWGGDENIDKISEFWIAVSRGPADKGYLLMDDFVFDERAKGEPDFALNINQVGYHPTDKKFFVIRIYDIKPNEKTSGTFRVINLESKEEVLSGNIEETGFSDWSGKYMKADFSSVADKGKYSIEADVTFKSGIYKNTSHPFEISGNVLAENTLSKELTYLEYQKCGIRCHKEDPVMGGYHDTLFDISKRNWSLPSLMYGLALYVNDSPYHPDNDGNGKPDDIEAFLWCADYMTRIANEEDGTLSWGGIEADFLKFMTYEEFIARLGPLKPEEDLIPRVKYEDKNLFATGFNTVALITSYPNLKKYDNIIAKRAEEVIFKAWDWIDNQPLKDARDYGIYLWTASEMYKFTKNDKYLYRVNSVTPKLLRLQALDFNLFEKYACGNFYTSETIKDFRFQYKYVYMNMAINMALINLAQILPEDDPLWFDIYYANYVFGENFIKGIASKTPYKQMGAGLEPKEKTKEDAGAWQAHADKDSSCKFEIISEKKDRHTKIISDLGNGHWAQISKNISVKNIEEISFEYMYDGKNNILEVRLTDKDDSSFGKKFLLEKTKKWQKKQLETSALKYLWGGDNVLDIENLKYICFAVSKDKGGESELSLKNIELVDSEGTIHPVSPGKAENKIPFVINYFSGPEGEYASAQNHGMNCDHLSMAYTAMKWGQIIGDLELEEFADNQVNWVLGANPLGYCMVMGAGEVNPEIMADYFAKPVLDGIIPNGIVGGKNEEPEWWGSGPSSGEDWIPHNAAYFEILSVLDSNPVLSGIVTKDGKPMENATVKIFLGDDEVKSINTDSNGSFGPINELLPQKEYVVKVAGKNMEKTIKTTLLSGSKKTLNVDFSRDIELEMDFPKNLKQGKSAKVKIKVSNDAIGQPYRILAKGVDIEGHKHGTIDFTSLSLKVTPKGDMPILFRFEILRKPKISKEVYIKSL